MDELLLSKEDDFELITRFFNFDLSDVEQQVFEKRMKEDASFRESFQIFQKMDTYIDKQMGQSEAITDIKASFKNALSSVDAAKSGGKKPDKKEFSILPLRRILSIAAAVLFLVIGGFVGRNFLSNNSSPATLAQNYWDNTNKITFSNLRSETGPSESTQKLITASDLYNDQRFSATINTLSTISQEAKDFPNAALLTGEAHLALQEYQAAIDAFHKVINHPEGTHKSSALWFQALAYLKTNQIDLAKANLNTIIQQKYPTAKKATELLGQLK